MIKEIKEIIQNPTIENVTFLVKWLWPNIKAAANITPRQANIVRIIAFEQHKRVSISAFTRYGKSQFVAIAVALYILTHENKKIKFIGPTDDQASLIKDYMSELILQCRGNLLLDIAELTAKGPQRIKAEASQRRLTFTNGCEYRVVTAFGKGFTAMGHGGDLIIMDEAALISRESYAKITRMLGDDPENAVLVELYNPWDRDTKAFDHSISERYHRIQIDYKIGLEEGRITEEFVNEMRDEITPLEFKVLYNSEFPDESEDSIFNLSHVRTAIEADFKIADEFQELQYKISNAHKYTEGEFNKNKKDIKEFTKIISCDVADKGLDFTVIYWGYEKNGKYQMINYYKEPKSENMEIAGKIFQLVKDFIGKDKGKVIIDCIGVGVGVSSRLKELLTQNKTSNVKLVNAHYGEGAINKDRYNNKKAENYFRLRQLFADGNMDIMDIPTLNKELTLMKWKLSSNGKIIIEDPQSKSPDYADALVYFTWKDKSDLAFAFG